MISRTTTALLGLAVFMAAMPANRAAAEGLSLNPRITAEEETSSQGALMMLLGKGNMDKPLNESGINIYGWLEAGYTYNHRHGTGSGSVPIIPGPLNHEYGDHFMLNQFTLRFEREVATDKFDVGGLIEVTYGTDAARMHFTGLGYDGSDPTDDNNPTDDLAVANVHPSLQFDIPQAYVNINLPVGSGLQLMIGKWVTLLGYETVDPRGNAFYSHSYLFSAVPYTQTGVLGSYQISEQLGAKLGVTRGWDIALEDNNAAIDVTGQVSYQFNKQLSAMLNWTCGPENDGDNGHYRTAINPIVMWQATEQLSFAADGLYVYDGGFNGTPGDTHHYGDIWGLTLYASYKLNEYVTINGRIEKTHTFISDFAGLDNLTLGTGGPASSTNFYEATLGVTIYPGPRDPWFKGLRIRPEIRYDWSEDSVYPTNNGNFKNQLTFGADVIIEF